MVPDENDKDISQKSADASGGEKKKAVPCPSPGRSPVVPPESITPATAAGSQAADKKMVPATGGPPGQHPPVPAAGQPYKPGRSAIFMPKLTQLTGSPPSPAAAKGRLSPHPHSFEGQGAGIGGGVAPSRPFGAPRYQPPRQAPANLPPPPKPWARSMPAQEHKAEDSADLKAPAQPASQTDADDSETGDNVPLPPEKKSDDEKA